MKAHPEDRIILAASHVDPPTKSGVVGEAAHETDTRLLGRPVSRATSLRVTPGCSEISWIKARPGPASGTAVHYPRPAPDTADGTLAARCAAV